MKTYRHALLFLLLNLSLMTWTRSQETIVQDVEEIDLDDDIAMSDEDLTENDVSDETIVGKSDDLNKDEPIVEDIIEEGEEEVNSSEEIIQTGPFVDLFGPSLLSLSMVDETHAQIEAHNTNDALHGKSVVGLYFSADWCGPCRQFTPELVQFYDEINSRQSKENSFEIIFISQCRDMNSFAQYFTHMNWLAMPFEEAAGQRGQLLSEKYKVQGIPTLVLLDDMGNTITTNARNQIPQDRAGIGFPWRNPIVSLYMTFVPKSLRFLVKSQISNLKNEVVSKIKMLLPFLSRNK